LLLRPVVQVPFDLPSFVVLRGHESLPRRSQFFDQPNVPQHQTGLRR
jgi:hypothetical protein